jgi:hypothetical protein
LQIVAEKTLQEIFGAGATQTATTITLIKADLPMTAAANNRGEQVFAAIAKRASTVLDKTSFDADPDRSINIQSGFDQIVYRTISGATTTLLQTALTVNFVKIQAAAGISPDDY